MGPQATNAPAVSGVAVAKPTTLINENSANSTTAVARRFKHVRNLLPQRSRLFLRQMMLIFPRAREVA